MVARVIPAILFGLLVTVSLAALSGADDPRAPRFALVTENRIEHEGGRAGALLLEAAAAVLTAYPDTYWFVLDRLDLPAARDLHAEVIAHLAVEPRPRSSDPGEYQVVLRFYPVSYPGALRAGRDADPPSSPDSIPTGDPSSRQDPPPDSHSPPDPPPTADQPSPPDPHSPPDPPPESTVLSEAVIVTTADRGGRYQRDETWALFRRVLESVLPEARPTASVTFVSSRPITVAGLPSWVEDERIATPSREVTVDLRTLRTYEVVVEAPGFRPQPVMFYLEREPLMIDVPLTRYPRHTVAFTARGVSWPGVEYTWYNRSTRWTAHLGITTFAWGLTPLEQLRFGESRRNREEEAELVTSLPLSEVELGAGRLFGDRDSPGRWYLTAGVLARITHGDLDWGLEPVAPAAFRLAFGRERELSRRFVFSHRLATDLLLLLEPSFLYESPWSVRIGPILWQLPLYRLGMRVVL